MPLIAAAIAAAVYAFYYAAACGFVIDDRTYFIENDLLTNLKPWDLWSIFTTPSNYWREHMPLTDLLFVTEYNIFGARPAGYHVVNLILYALLALVVFRLTLALYVLLTGEENEGYPLRRSALLVTTLFVLHPVHVEVVAYVMGQKDLLYAIFSLLSLSLFASCLTKSGSSRHGALAGAVALYYMAFLSKNLAVANAVAFPALWLLAGRPGGHRIPKAALFWTAANLPVLAWLYYSVKVLAPPGMTATSPDLVFNLLRAVRIIGAHTLLAVFPYPLNFGYPFETAWSFDGNAIVGLAVLAMAAAACALRPRSLAAVGLCLYVAYFIPVLQIFFDLQNAAIYDRYLFVPLLGLCILAERGFHLAWRRFPAARKVLAAATVALALALAVLSNGYVKKYKDDVSLLGHGYRHYGHWSRIPFDYVYSLIEAGELAEAARVTEEEKSFSSPLWVRDYFRGWICLEGGNLSCALVRLSNSAALSMGYYYPFAEVQLGRAFMLAGDLKRAEGALATVISSKLLNPLEYFKAKDTLRQIEEIKRGGPSSGAP